MTAWQPSVRIAISASAWAILPYLAYNVGLIVFHEGSIIHMSKLEWAIFTAASSLLLWLGSAFILVVAAAVTRNNPWLIAALALAVFTAIALKLLPYSWTGLLDPFENGFGAWLFWTGILSIFLYLILRRRKAVPAMR